MLLKTVTVVVNLVGPNGEALVDAQVEATLSAYEIDDGVVVPTKVRAYTNTLGVANLKLWPNARGVAGTSYAVRVITHPDLFDVVIVVPDVAHGTSIAITDIISARPPQLDVAQQAVITAQAAAAAAAASAAAAAAAASAAASSSSSSQVTQCLLVVCSDESTGLAATPSAITFRMPYAMTLKGVRASLTAAPTGSALTVGINMEGVPILSTVLTIDDAARTSTTAVTPAVVDLANLADDAEITIDIDAVGATSPGAGLKVYLIGEVA